MVILTKWDQMSRYQLLTPLGDPLRGQRIVDFNRHLLRLMTKVNNFDRWLRKNKHHLIS